MSVFKAFFTVSFYTLLSRISGYVRDIFIASFMGTGVLAQAFLVAFRLPNFLRRIFAEGAFNAAFLPIFSGMLNSEGKEKAEIFASKMLSLLVIILAIIVVLAIIFMEGVVTIVAPGFLKEGGEQTFALAVNLSRIMFIYILLISVASLFGGILNSIGKFWVWAAAPILLNLSMIFGIFAFEKITPTIAHALSYGVVIAGFLQCFAVIYVCVKSNFIPKFLNPFNDSNVKTCLRRMIPGIIGASVVQVNILIDTIIASFLPGGVAFLYFAERVSQLPLSIIGTAMGTALLPALSRHIKEKNYDLAVKDQNRALELSLFFTLPAMIALILIAEPLVKILFERGVFNSYDTKAVAYALIAFSIGLPAFVLIKILTTSFFADGDTKTPVIIGVKTVAINLAGNLLLVPLFMKLNIMPHTALALSTSFSSWVSCLMLINKLKERNIFSSDQGLKTSVRKIILASVIMGIAIFATMHLLKLGALLNLAITIIMGGLVFISLAQMLKIYNLKEILGILRRHKK